MNYLISYNHSGNTWVRYCLEFLTKLPTHGHSAFSISERNNNFLNIDIKENPICIKRHEIISGEILDTDNVVLLVRNPIECIKKSVSNINNELNKYYSLIAAYENHKGNKAVVFYKDLFHNVNSLFDIVECFNNIKIDDNIVKRMIKLMDDFEYHKQQSKSIYQNKTNEPGIDITLTPECILNNKIVKEACLK
jgi:hypothetical protein